MQDTYYDRSISDQQDALDKELENFREEKEKEIEGWDEYLENTEQVVSDSLTTIQENTGIVYQTLQAMGEEYSLSIADAIVSPWEDGAAAIQDYSEQFGLSMSSTVEELQKLAAEYKKVMVDIDDAGSEAVQQVDNNTNTYQKATYKEPAKPKTTDTPKQSNNVAVGNVVTASPNAKIYSNPDGKNGSQQYYKDDPDYVVLAKQKKYVQVRHASQKTGVTGWINEKDVRLQQNAHRIAQYASGTKGVNKNQLALIDELGEELVIRPSNGRMTFLEKGSGVIPADLTANLMEWGELDPSTMLAQNKPEITMSPSVVNNNMELNIDASVGELIHVDTLNGNNIAEVTKIVDKAWNKYMKELNGQIRRYTNR